MEYLKSLTASVKKAQSIRGYEWYDELHSLQNLMSSMEELHDTEAGQYPLNKRPQGIAPLSAETLKELKELELKLRELYPRLVKLNETISFRDFQE